MVPMTHYDYDRTKSAVDCSNVAVIVTGGTCTSASITGAIMRITVYPYECSHQTVKYEKLITLIGWWSYFYEWAFTPICKPIICLSTKKRFVNHQPRAPPVYY